MSNKISNLKSQISNLLIILLFLIWRAIDNWIIYISSKIIPFLGFFPYLRELFTFGVDQVTQSLANFDGIHYLLIAHRGNYGQWEQAFFPLYPLLIRALNPIFSNELITGLIISNISFLIGLWVLTKYLKLISTDFNQFQLILTILVFPTSFFFGAVYTEGLFFLLFVLTLYFLKKQRYWLTGLFAILSSMTRFIGVFLVMPIILSQISKRKSQNYALNLKSILLILSPIFGLAIYCFYLWQTTGDPLMFLTSQPVFGANRSTSIILLPQVVWRYLKIFFTAAHDFQYYISVFEFIVFISVFVILILDLFKHLEIKNWKLIRNLKLEIRNFDMLALNLFSFANLILPTLTGTFSSIPRYALFSLSFFIYLAKVKNRWIKTGIIIIFFILHIVILSLFGLGYFVS